MIQRIRTMLLRFSVFLLIFAPALLLAVSVSAQGADIQNSTCTGADTLQVPPGGTAGSGCGAITTDEGSFNRLLTRIINVISVIVGVVAVIMIIYGGFRYITSGGSPEKVTGAKNTILYGLIGLIIVALAQIIVRFVLKQVSSA
ncbi:MAG TPA: pilin [Candidatus Saccharimonadales bacterium]